MPFKMRNTGIDHHNKIDWQPSDPTEYEHFEWFWTRSRSLSNYIYRKFYLKSVKQILPSRFYIHFSETPRLDPYDNGNWIVEIPDRSRDLVKIPPGTDLVDFMIEIFDEGFCKFESALEFPRAELMSLAHEYREGGCVNSWVTSSKAPKNLGLRGQIVHSLSMDEFTKDFVMFRGRTQIHRETVFRSGPREESWWGRSSGVWSLDYKDGRFLIDGYWSKDIREFL